MQSHFSLIWESVAEAVPEHVALIQGERRISWRDYENRAARLAQRPAGAAQVDGQERLERVAELVRHDAHLVVAQIEEMARRLGRRRRGCPGARRHGFAAWVG